MKIQILIILFIVFISCKNTSDKKNGEQNNDTNFSELEIQYSNLKTHFGEKNIQIDYFGDSYNKIKVTHIPTGKIQLGEKYNTQIENAVKALENLKMELISNSKYKTKSNLEFAKFLENPINFKVYKKSKNRNVTTTVTNGKEYYFNTKKTDSLFYQYYYYNENSNRISQITVLKYGQNKHTYDDETETLIEFEIFENDSDLEKANFVGLSKKELVIKLGTDFLFLNNKMIYSNKNKVLIFDLDNSKVKSYRYTKLNTEKIDKDLIRIITK